jgi:hypothetical protein
LAELRCPECGRSFDPANPESFNQGKAMGPLARGLLGPAPWHGWLIRAYCIAALIGSAIYPLNRWSAIALFIVFWILLNVPHALREGLRSIVVKRYRQPAASAQIDAAMTRRAWRWALCTGLLVLTQAPLCLALAISYPWLEPLARERYERMPFATVNSTPLPRHQYGLFRVMRVDVNTYGVDLYIWGSEIGSPRLRYLPERASFRDVLKGSALTPSWGVP